MRDKGDKAHLFNEKARMLTVVSFFSHGGYAPRSGVRSRGGAVPTPTPSLLMAPTPVQTATQGPIQNNNLNNLNEYLIQYIYIIYFFIIYIY